MKEIKLFLIYFFMILFSLTINSAILLAGGEDANGPDLQGQAIPVLMDRTVLIDDLERAVRMCAQQSLISLLMQRDGKVNSKIYAISDDDLSYIVSPGACEDNGVVPSIYSSPGLVIIGMAMSNSVSSIKPYALWTTDYERENDQVTHTAHLATELPFLKYQLASQNTEYDDFGYPINTKIYIKDITMENAIPLKEGMEGVMHNDKGYYTRFKINVVDYKNCLLTGIQKLRTDSNQK